jgi:hypothetical protein
MRKLILVVLFTSSVSLGLLPEKAFGIGPQLEVDCGTWNYYSDSNISYRELDGIAFFGYAGSQFDYVVKFYNSAKSKRSLGTFKGTHEIKNPETETHITEIPLNMKFAKTTSSIMYKAKYIRAEIKFTDFQGFEAYHRCIWKWK